MNWEAVGAIGEVVGALGVIATLLYLAIQIRRSTAQARSDSHIKLNEVSRNLTLKIAEDLEGKCIKR